MENKDNLEARIQYQFRQPDLFTEAITHASVRYESKRPVRDNQRLEFLGDAVLQLVLSEALYRLFPYSDEGLMTKLRTRLVSTSALVKMARKLELGKFLIIGKGEENSGGRERASTLADALEALIGAIYLDGTLEAARYFVLRLVDSELKALAAMPVEINPKGELQEILQGATGEAPTYEIIASHGPDHLKHFEAHALWRGQTLGNGSGPRKREAEVSAAAAALANPELKALLAEHAPDFVFTGSLLTIGAPQGTTPSDEALLV